MFEVDGDEPLEMLDLIEVGIFAAHFPNVLLGARAHRLNFVPEILVVEYVVGEFINKIETFPSLDLIQLLEIQGFKERLVLHIQIDHLLGFEHLDHRGDLQPAYLLGRQEDLEHNVLVAVVLHLDFGVEGFPRLHYGEVYFVDLELEVRFDDGADGVEVDLVGEDIACYDFAFYGLLSFDLLVLFVLLGDGGGCDVEELAGEFLFWEDLDGLRVEDVDVVGGGEEHDFLEEDGFVPEEDGDFGPCALVDIPEIYPLRGDL